MINNELDSAIIISIKTIVNVTTTGIPETTRTTTTTTEVLETTRSTSTIQTTTINTNTSTDIPGNFI